MIESRLVEDEEEEKLVREAMPTFKDEKFRRLHGFWKGGKCIGGLYLLAKYPYDAGVELDTSLPSLLPALSKCLNDLLEVNGQLIATISETNLKAIKFVRTLGFVEMYVDEGRSHNQLVRENWAYKDKYPLK
jgi:hypothetical protein